MSFIRIARQASNGRGGVPGRRGARIARCESAGAPISLDSRAPGRRLPHEDQVLRVGDRGGRLRGHTRAEWARLAAATRSGADTIAAMEHRFTGPAYTLGIEEELMILDEETLDLSNSIETVLAALPPVEGEPQVKEELMESVLSLIHISEPTRPY